jgi:hypothetical protein
VKCFLIGFHFSFINCFINGSIVSGSGYHEFAFKRRCFGFYPSRDPQVHCKQIVTLNCVEIHATKSIEVTTSTWGFKVSSLLEQLIADRIVDCLAQAALNDQAGLLTWCAALTFEHHRDMLELTEVTRQLGFIGLFTGWSAVR